MRTSTTGRYLRIGGRKLLNFCSNDYLGLAAEPSVMEAAQAAILRYGVGAGAASLLSGWTDLHENFSHELARFLKRDSALLFSSGYLANLGMIASRADRHSEIFHDRLNHASLIDGVRMSGALSTRYAHANVEALETALARSTRKHKFIITDTVFSMDGDIAPLRELSRLSECYQAELLCDEAHAFGVLGEGRGACAEAGLSQTEVPLVMVTFGKALGAAGAAVVGSSERVEELLQKARTHTYDTALPPLLVAAASRSLKLIQEEPERLLRLHSRIREFRQGCKDMGISLPESRTPVQPVLLGDEARALEVAQELNEAGCYARAIRPPTVPVGTSRVRICLSAAHEPEDIALLVNALANSLRPSAVS